MSKVTWSAQAISDLEAIKHYISHDSATYAVAFIKRIFVEAEKAAILPNSGRKVPEANLDFVREVFINDYRLVYSVVNNSITVITVHHGAKKLTYFES